MTHSVERRAEQRETARPATVPANNGLTRRERKVKDLLLRELKKGSDVQLLSYDEIQNIEKTLNAEWIEEQLGVMYKAHRHFRWMWAIPLVFVINFVSDVIETLPGEIPAFLIGFGAIMLPAAFLMPYFGRRAIRRRIFIFEALRELAGADEAGTTLDKAIQEADALITRIVDRELAGEAVRPAKSLGRLRTN